MSSIRIEVNGDIQPLLQRMSRIAGIDLRGTVSALAEAVRESTVSRFVEERDPEGKKWKPSVRAREEGGKTLTKSARLRNSIHAESGATGFAVGTNTVYAATHQFGASRTVRARRRKCLTFKIGERWVSVKQATVNIPARPFLGISGEDEAEIKATLEEVLGEE